MTVKGFKKWSISHALDETDDDDILWNGSEEDCNVSSECEEDEGTNCEWRQWHWLVKADWIWHALCIKCVKLILKYFVLEDFIFEGSS